MSVLVFLIAAQAIAAAQPLGLHSEASIRGDVVRLSDVADVSVLPIALRERAAATPVARLRSREQVVSSRAIAWRARGAIPALSPWLPDAPDRPIRVRSTEPAGRARTSISTAIPPPSAISAGDLATLHIQVGPVTVEREVTALQTARAGRPVFVRTADGVVLSARLAAAR